MGFKVGVASDGKSSKEYPLPKPATVAARCIRIVDLGTHTEQWGDEEPKKNRKCMLSFEISEKMEDDKPFVVQQEYTAIVSQNSNLGKLIFSWLPEPLTNEELADFDLLSMLGKCCLLNLKLKTSKKGKEYIVIESAVPMPDAFPEPEPYNDLFSFVMPEDINDEKLSKLWGLEKYIIKEKSEESKIHNIQFPEKKEEIADDGKDLPF